MHCSRRRCIGRNLTFASLSSVWRDASGHSLSPPTVIEVVFVRSFELWTGSIFPGRKSALEIGMGVSLIVYNVEGEEHPVVGGAKQSFAQRRSNVFHICALNTRALLTVY